MQFNKDAITALLSKSDAELWGAIRSIAAASGINIPAAMPSSADMAKIRAALAGASSEDIANAMQIVDRYKRGAR